MFQYHLDQRDRSEFDKMMGALKTFASTKYVVYNDYLTPLCSDISESSLVKSKLASITEMITLKDDTKKEIASSTTEELEEFKMKLK